MDKNQLSLAPSPLFFEEGHSIVMKRGDLAVVVDRRSGKVTQILSKEFPSGMLGDALLELNMTRNGQADGFEQAEVLRQEDRLVIKRWSQEGGELNISLEFAAELDALDIIFETRHLPRPDGGMNAALCSAMRVNFPHTLVHDHPYAVTPICPRGSYLKKYPSGDWMTSPQWFEQVHRPFTALQFVDFDAGDRGLLVIHDGSQQFFESEGTVRQVLSMYDPWDEEHFYPSLEARIRIVPHGRISNAERWKLAQEALRPLILSHVGSWERRESFGIKTLSPVRCVSESVVMTALYRERDAASAEYPYVVRLVEFNGVAAEATLLLAGKVASARKTNLLGETLSHLKIQPAKAGIPIDSWQGEWSQINLTLRPFEITTLYLDLEMGRKQPRHLDSYRHVWATAHKVS